MTKRSTAGHKSPSRPFKVTYLVVFEEKDTDLAEGLVESTRRGGDAAYVAQGGPPVKGKVTGTTRDGSVVEVVVEGTRS
jgi:hypothetical protein